MPPSAQNLFLWRVKEGNGRGNEKTTERESRWAFMANNTTNGSFFGR